jgi:integrase
MSIHPRVRKRDGRRVYDVRLRDPSGKVYNRTFETKREAEAFQDAERADRRQGRWIDPRLSATPFQAVAARWLDSNPRKRGSSRARDESIITNHLNPLLSNRPIGSVSPSDIQGIVQRWTGELAPTTVNRNYATLRAIFTYAVNSDLIWRGPCRGIGLPQAKPRESTILDAETLAGLASQMGDFALMPYLAVVLPLRWGEIAGLRVGRLDFLRKTITVSGQLTRGAKGRMIEEDPKTDAGRRTLAAPDWLMKLLADHLAARGITGADPDELLFVSREGGPLDYSNWRYRVWLPARRAVGLDGLHFHDLRHTAATALVSAGIDVKTAQVRLGHANPQITLRVYAQASSEADRAAAETVGDLFRPRDGRAIDQDEGHGETTTNGP